MVVQQESTVHRRESELPLVRFERPRATVNGILMPCVQWTTWVMAILFATWVTWRHSQGAFAESLSIGTLLLIALGLFGAGWIMMSGPSWPVDARSWPVPHRVLLVASVLGLTAAALTFNGAQHLGRRLPWIAILFVCLRAFWPHRLSSVANPMSPRTDPIWYVDSAEPSLGDTLKPHLGTKQGKSRGSVDGSTGLRNALSKDSDLDSAADAVYDALPTELPTELDQWFRRGRREDGKQYVHGLIRIPVASGQRQTHSHVAICPPFRNSGEVSVEQIDGVPARVELGLVQPHGLRLDIRLAEASSVPTDLVVELYVVDSQ